MKQKIFEETLKNAYDHSAFVKFVREFLTDIKTVAPNDYDDEIGGGYEKHVAGYYHIGDYNFDSVNKMIVLAVNLKKGGTVERARSMQRGFVRLLIERSYSVAALVAFYSEDEPNKWRLSFVRMETSIDFGSANNNLTVKLTPAKRYSYLVGKDEPCSTALHRLFPIFADDKKHPSIDEFEEAFSVETVTQEFFKLYDLKYNQVREYLEHNEDFKRESQEHGFTAEQFSKKLLGQIIFLYFLQKKGWLGVAKGEKWGSGSKNFMRQIFNDCTAKGKNFFNDYLEPLFYTALNKNREGSYYEPLDTKIPFLNGGLFEELEHYNWRDNNFDIPNHIFSDANINGDGILDVFDRYNFTMNEDEPLEREVAIDPEMLGKVFENLLNSDDRKASGSFYTPREIVHYMCRETLINYLAQKSQIAEEAVRNFIMFGEYLNLPAEITNNAKKLDELLKKVTVVDPAVGSGAFLLGMLNEIVKARETLATCMNAPYRPYNLKLDTIKNCLFACDIEPSAVDIAKLRLWLSIVIDDELRADDEPRPLPNLDCNIICGNSLVDEFEGNKLLDERVMRLDQKDIDCWLDNLRDTQISLFSASKAIIKDHYRACIRAIYNNIVLKSVKDSNLFAKYLEAAAKRSQPFILWQLYFPQVFRGKDDDGFDIVIGNPPYVQLSMEKNVPEQYKSYLKQKYGTSAGRLNLFIFMIHLGINLLSKDGFLSYIVPNTILTQEFYKDTRELILTKHSLISLVDYMEMPFDNAIVENITMLVCKQHKSDEIEIYKGLKDNIELFKKIESKNFMTPPNYVFNINYNQFTESLFSGSVPLNSLCNVNQAIALKGDKSISIKTQYKKGYYKLLDGRNISKYAINWDGVYLDYSLDRIHSCKRKDIFECKEKLLFRRVSTNLIAVYDDEQYFALNTLVVVTPKNPNVNLKYILALLNSKLMNYIYKNKFKSVKKVFSEIQARSVEQLPIKYNDKYESKIISLVDALIERKKKDDSSDTCDLEEQVDNLIYKIYNLNEEDIKYIEENQ